MSEDNEGKTFSVEVAEEMGVGDNPGGGDDREQVMQKVLERKVELSSNYVKTPLVKSRRVKPADLDRLLEDAKLMHEMTLIGRGEYTNAVAIAHTQVCNIDPLRFFVTAQGAIIVNPVIIGSNYVMKEVTEGCLSHPEEPMKTVPRLDKVQVKFRTIMKDKDTGALKLSNELDVERSALDSLVMQQMCLLLNGHTIYTSGKIMSDTKGE